MRIRKHPLLSSFFSTFLLGFAVISQPAAAQTTAPNEWTWMGGSSTVPASCSAPSACGGTGWYGILQTPAAANVPGRRGSAVSWTDSKGNLWLFGGWGFDSAGNPGYLNDLWEFSPSTAEWTWMGGSSTIAACSNGDGCGPSGVYGTLGTPAAANTPGGRENAAGWTDDAGNLWLFGGLGFAADGTYGFLNDLWKFNPATNQWTWLGGSDSVSCVACGPAGQYGTLGIPAAGNVPGGRAAPTAWTDHNGNFWIFGGIGEDARPVQCILNDFWEFTPSTSEWAWMGGDNLCFYFMTGYPGVYGTVGVPAPGNIPWSLEYPSGWTDSNGNLWLFAGIGEDTTATGYYLNDMWEYLPSIKQWEWTSANSIGGGGPGIGIYGTMGVASPGNIPGERDLSASWTDSNGNFWLLGGEGVVDASYAVGSLNDLWEFKPSLNEWAWMGGSNAFICLEASSGICVSRGQPGVYGALGTPAPGNVPGGRSDAATWTDKNGNLWLFGGDGDDAQGVDRSLNDLWQYSLTGSPTVPPPSPAAPPEISLAAGTYNSPQTLTISDQTPGATIYYTTNGTSPNSSSPVYQGQIAVPSSEIVESIAVASDYALSAVAAAAYTISLPQAATPTFSVPAGTYTTAQSVTISDATAGAAVYYTTDGKTTPTTSSSQYTGAIAVSATETIQAIAAATNYTDSAVASATYTINLPPDFSVGASPASMTVKAGQSGTTTVTVTPVNGFNAAVSFSCSGLPTGVYCGFSPPTVTPSGGAASTTLTVSTSPSTASIRRGPRGLFPEAVLAAALCWFGWKRRRLPMLGLLIASVIALGLVNGCGGGGSSGGGSGGGGSSQPQTYSITVAGTSGSLSRSTTFSLTVD